MSNQTPDYEELARDMVKALAGEPAEVGIRAFFVVNKDALKVRQILDRKYPPDLSARISVLLYH